MAQRQRVAAIVILDTIVRQYLIAHFPRKRRLEITKLVAQHQAAFLHDAGCYGRVAVGSDVPVIRYREFRTGVAGGADGGRQNPRFALPIERKAQIRCVQYGLAEEFHARIARGAELASLVDLEIAGTHEPVVVAHLAGRIAAAQHAVLVLTFEYYALSIAAAAGGVDLYLVPGFLDRAALGFQIQPQAGAFKHVTALLEAHIAPRIDFVFGFVVAQPVGIDGLAAPAQAHRAFGLEFLVLVALHLVGVDKQRQRVLVVSGKVKQ